MRAGLLAVLAIAALEASCGTGFSASTGSGGGRDSGSADTSSADGASGDSPASDAAAHDGTTTCGAAAEPCCNATACSSGLTCIGGTCIGPTAADGGPKDAGADGPALAEGGPPPVTLASGLSLPFGVTVDSTNVYWAEETRVAKIATGGGPITTLASAGGTGIAVDSKSVYWLAQGNPMKVPLDGGTASTLAQAASVGYGLAVDSDESLLGGLQSEQLPRDGTARRRRVDYLLVPRRLPRTASPWTRRASTSPTMGTAR